MPNCGRQMKASSQKRGEVWSQGAPQPGCAAKAPLRLCVSGELSPGLSLLMWSTNRSWWSSRRDALEFPKFAGRQRRSNQVLRSMSMSSMAREEAVPRGSASKSINASSSLEAAWLSWASVTHCYITQLNYLEWVGSICHFVNEDLAMLMKHIGCLGCWVNLYYTRRDLWLKFTRTRWTWQGQKHYVHRRQTGLCTSAK